jgi:hypothetical protein
MKTLLKTVLCLVLLLASAHAEEQAWLQQARELLPQMETVSARMPGPEHSAACPDCGEGEVRNDCHAHWICPEHKVRLEHAQLVKGGVVNQSAYWCAKGNHFWFRWHTDPSMHMWRNDWYGPVPVGDAPAADEEAKYDWGREAYGMAISLVAVEPGEGETHRFRIHIQDRSAIENGDLPKDNPDALVPLVRSDATVVGRLHMGIDIVLEDVDGAFVLGIEDARPGWQTVPGALLLLGKDSRRIGRITFAGDRVTGPDARTGILSLNLPADWSGTLVIRFRPVNSLSEAEPMRRIVSRTITIGDSD